MLATNGPSAGWCIIAAWRSTLSCPATLDGARRAHHLENVADNLQLVADMGYGDVALAVRTPDGALRVVADARPMTAVAAVAFTPRRPHALRARRARGVPGAARGRRAVAGDRRRTTRGISYVTSAYPVGRRRVLRRSLLRDLTHQVVEAPGKMELAFMAIADDLIGLLARVRC